MEDKQYMLYTIVNYLEASVYPEGLAKGQKYVHATLYEELQRISKLIMRNCITVT